MSAAHSAQPAVAGLLAGITLLFLASACAGVGHGTYLPFGVFGAPLSLIPRVWLASPVIMWALFGAAVAMVAPGRVMRIACGPVAGRSAVSRLVAVGLLAGFCIQPLAAAPAACTASRFPEDVAAPMTEYQQEPTVVAEVRGILRSAGGEWPHEMRPLFDLIPATGRPLLRSVHAASDGRFRMRGIGPGLYCFRASAPGWQTVIGTLVIDPRAAERIFSVTLPLGV